MTKNWKDIHPDFTEGLQKEWEEKGFNYEETKKWIDIGLGVNDGNCAEWLKVIKEKDKRIAELERIQNQLKSTQLRLSGFLESYIAEKQEQINQEKDSNKILFLKEELKVLVEFQNNNEEENTNLRQQIYSFESELKKFLKISSELPNNWNAKLTEKINVNITNDMIDINAERDNYKDQFSSFSQIFSSSSYYIGLGLRFEFIEVNDGRIKRIKYQFIKPDNSKLNYNEFISLLKSQDKYFFEVFRGSLSDATSKLSAYFWECPPVSRHILNRPFEFVVTKSDALENIRQDYSSFERYFDAWNHNEYVCSFPNLGRDATLVVPFPQKKRTNIHGKKPEKIINNTKGIITREKKNESNENEIVDYVDYKNISQFTENAPVEQQMIFWKEVVDRLSESININKSPRWLSTNGLGVHYLHVRIDISPKYYYFTEYRKVNESYRIQNQELVAQTHHHVPPHGVPGSSKK